MSDVGSVREWEEIAKDMDAGRDGCTPMFYMKEVQNKARSKAEGRICFDQKEYVEIFVPGDKTLRPNRPVAEADKKRWPQAYARFQATQEETLDGTPVDQWPYLNRAQVAEMKANGVMTVEAIADCADGLLDRLGPNARDLQKRARQFLQPQSDTETELRAELGKLEAEAKNKDMEISHLTQRLEAIEAQLDQKEQAPPVKRGPGRPRKNAA